MSPRKTVATITNSVPLMLTLMTVEVGIMAVAVAIQARMTCMALSRAQILSRKLGLLIRHLNLRASSPGSSGPSSGCK